MLCSLAMSTTRPCFPWRSNNVMKCLRRVAAGFTLRPVAFSLPAGLPGDQPGDQGQEQPGNNDPRDGTEAQSRNGNRLRYPGGCAAISRLVTVSYFHRCTKAPILRSRSLSKLESEWASWPIARRRSWSQFSLSPPADGRRTASLRTLPDRRSPIPHDVVLRGHCG